MAKKQRQKNYSASEVRDSNPIFAGFDCETEGLGGRLLMLQAGVMGEVRTFVVPRETSDRETSFMISQFFDFILDYGDPVIWYGHFAQYDWRYLVPWLIDTGHHLDIGMRTETDIYRITVEAPDGRKIEMRDSGSLFARGLDKFAQSFCPELPKLSLGSDIAHFDPTNVLHIEYAKRDVEILMAGLPRFDSLIRKNFGVGLGHTAAGTAMAAWQHSIPGGTFYKSSTWGDREEFIREGYYGGLVFLTSQDLHEGYANECICETYDVNSSYPSVMCDFGVPDGDIIKTLDYDTENMGLYKVRVRAPENLIIPILPSRNSRGAMRWTRGEFDTTVTNRELIFAVKQGYEILEVHEGFVFESVVFPFNDFINHCKEIRKSYKGKPEEEIAKLMQNSLYGKYAARRDRVTVHMPGDDETEWGVPLDLDSRLWVKTEFNEIMKCKPEWSCFITAHARLKLLQGAYSIGIENVLYGDTDSLTVFAGSAVGKITIGSEYGEFKLEKQWRSFRAIAPKVYSGQLISGKNIGAAKGLPRKNLQSNHWLDLLNTGMTEAEALSLNSLKVALQKSNVIPAQTLKRKSSQLTNSVNWDLTESVIRPKMSA